MIRQYLKYIVIVVVLPFIFLSCNQDIKNADFQVYDGPLMTIENLHVAYTDSGRVKVKLSTALQKKYSSLDEEYPKSVYVNFLDKNMVEYSQLRANSGSYSKSKNLYTLRGNVFFNNRLLKQSLATEELFWDPVGKKIYSVKTVTIKTPTESIIASGGMNATEDFSRYQLRQPKGVFLVDSIRTVVDTTGE
ncbi:MAG: LPS export ABC transporter periplasmic protein LptC [Leadbetterella sp.]